MLARQTNSSAVFIIYLQTPATAAFSVLTAFPVSAKAVLLLLLLLLVLAHKKSYFLSVLSALNVATGAEGGPQVVGSNPAPEAD